MFGILLQIISHLILIFIDNCNKCYFVVVPILFNHIGFIVIVTNIWAAFKLLITEE
jgi:hypothetical protein